MLDHPFGSLKGGLLRGILVRGLQEEAMESAALRALFPELYLARGSYAAQVMPSFSLRSFRAGDRSEEMIEGAKAQLRAFGITDGIPAAEESPCQTVEDMADTTRAARFLATHYYYHGMFAWFWKMFEQVASTGNTQLLMQASEVAFFEGLQMEDVRVYYDRCFAKDADGEMHQRLWHRLSVMYALRREWSIAEHALEQSRRLLPLVRSEQELNCRVAEWHNSKALLSIGHHDIEGAAAELMRGLQELERCDPTAKRVQEVRDVIRYNQNRLHADWMPTSTPSGVQTQEWEAE